MESPLSRGGGGGGQKNSLVCINVWASVHVYMSLMHACLSSHSHVQPINGKTLQSPERGERSAQLADGRCSQAEKQTHRFMLVRKIHPQENKVKF